MFQFLPIFTIVALASTNFHRRTGQVDVGSFINAMMVHLDGSGRAGPPFFLRIWGQA